MVLRELSLLVASTRAMRTMPTGGPATTILWFRDELRVRDNALLATAALKSEAVVPLFCFDPRIYNGQATVDGTVLKCGARRAQFVRESVVDLRENLAAACGLDLIVRRASPAEAVADVARLVGGGGPVRVVCSESVCSEERRDEAAVEAFLRAQGGVMERVWDGTLYHRDDAQLPVDETFTTWRTRVEKRASIRAEIIPPPKPGWKKEKKTGFLEVVAGAVPSLEEMGYSSQPVDLRGDFFNPRGGETAALVRLQRFVWDEDRLKTYFDTRNGMAGQGYSTKLAPWLARGCVSARTVARECQRYEAELVQNKSTYWVVFELVWRDYFVFYALKHGAKVFQRGGAHGMVHRKKWATDAAKFDAWRRGLTGAPLVDANMRELAATGFMSNRGRQNVASYLVHDLALDWRLGATHFEAELVDYTPEANWGNWHAAAGLQGGRVNRFNILKQSKDYDPDGTYVKLWCPELAQVPAPACFEPHKLNQADRARYGLADKAYPAPILLTRAPPLATPGADATRWTQKLGSGRDARTDQMNRNRARRHKRGNVQHAWNDD